MKLLFAVDDDSTALLYYQHMLKDEYAVETFRNVKQFKQRIESGLPDIVIVDLIMPEMDGYTLIDWIKAQYPELPILIVSSCDGAEHSIAAQNNNVGFLKKGSKTPELLEALKCLM